MTNLQEFRSIQFQRYLELMYSDIFLNYNNLMLIDLYEIEEF